MMQKRTLYSLLLISFIVAFAASMSVANTVTIESKSNLPRCATQSVEINADVTTAEVAAVEFVFEINTASGCGYIEDLELTWELPAGVLSNRTALDLSQADGVAPDTIRFAAMRVDDGDGVLVAGAQLVATLGFKTVDCCEGAVSIDNTVFDYVNATCDITTQFVDAADFAVVIPTVVASALGIANQIPTIEAVDDAEIAWIPGGPTYTTTLVGDDNDLTNGCEALTYSKVSGPTALTVYPNGDVSYTAEPGDIGYNDVEVKVTDACGGEATTSFVICVTNVAPTLACPDDAVIGWGDTYNGIAVGDDPDGGPFSLVYSIIDNGGALFPLTINAATGEIEAVTDYDSTHTGSFDIVVSVTDGAAIDDPLCSAFNADTCMFTLTVVPFQISIAKLHGEEENGYNGVVQGQYVDVPVTMLNSGYVNYPMGGFDFLIAYDPTALNLNVVNAGDFIDDCEWEYFTYRNGYNGNCGNGCPSGLVRIVAMAETNDGPHHPECLTNTAGISNELAVLNFLVTNDRTFECMFIPVKFFWVDCGDNGISSQGGDTLFIAEHVFNYTGMGFDEVTGTDSDDSWLEITDFGAGMPGYTGPEMPFCDVSDKYWPVRLIDFRNGGVDIICSEDIDAPGDVNMNGIAYEIADAVMFTNYFIEGLGAFPTEFVDGAIAATDVNKDGITLSVSDLVYLIRVVIGDAVPYAKVSSIESTYSYQDGVLNTAAELGGAYFVFEGEANVASLVDGVEFDAKYRDGNTHVIMTIPHVAGASAFTGDLLNADAQLVSFELATYDGQQVVAKNVPKYFKLNQNYPNPFNPTTTIAFDLPKASEWTVGVYNITGQLVETFSGQDEAGQINVVWDATDLASGVYFYKVVAGSSSKTMKAVLLK